ncbi:MAG: GNAT family N-acetyltransferase [Hyphomicrobiaceae bacterium]
MARSARSGSRGSAGEAGLSFSPATAGRWRDLETLFGPERGANGGCWCQWWRIGRPEWNELGRDGRKARFEAEVGSGPAPGILAYRGEVAVGWCAVAPRSSTPRMQSSRIARPAAPGDDGVAAIDHDDVWAITCFFIAPAERKGGMMRALIKAAVAQARAGGARAVEAIPIDPRRELVWGEGFVGIASVFAIEGFVEIARRSPTRPLMRLTLRP